MKNPKFQLFKGGNGEFYFRLNAINGKIILASEGYTTKSACENGILSVKENSQNSGRYDKRESVNGQYYFVLKAGNGEIIGKSEMYTTNSACDNGIHAVMRDAPGAEVEILS